jgi:hypothetical protein
MNARVDSVSKGEWAMEKTIYSQLQLLGLGQRYKKHGASADKQTEAVRELPKGHSAIQDAIIVLLSSKGEAHNSDGDQEAVRERVRFGIKEALTELRRASSRRP